jgi:hypothetical protein
VIFPVYNEIAVRRLLPANLGATASKELINVDDGLTARAREKLAIPTLHG